MNTTHPALDVLTATLHDAADQPGVPSPKIAIEHVGGQDWRDGCSASDELSE